MTDRQNEALIFFESCVARKESGFSRDETAILDLINSKVAGGNSLDEILDFIFDETGKIIPCDRLDMAFVADENSRMVLHYVRARYEPLHLKKGFASDIHGGSIQKVFQSGCPSIIRDMEVHARNNPQSDSARFLLLEKIRSSMVCPLVVDGRPVGMLMCRSRKAGAYGEHEVMLQMAFAERLGQAVEKAYRIEQLSAAMQSYMEMLSFVSHELKNPISSIIMLGKTLSSGYFGEMGDKQREIVDRMVKRAEYLLNLTGEYLNLAHFETGEFHLRPREVDFYKDVAAHSLEIVAAMMEEQKVRFEQEIDPALPSVKCDPELMKIVLTNLLSNGVKYSSRGGSMRLSITPAYGHIRVSVWNEGPGFPESEKVHLFRRFSKLQTPELMERKGHGVGLYVTWKIIQLHGGRIWADSKHGEWAEFIFEIPPLMDQCLLN
ncbi:MAG: GAF domain-containing sensor histidine kinase [Spirochaetes bacterium]|nr:GAF domain-containing sensor histidine kinase [Spirochaetota bacterium]